MINEKLIPRADAVKMCREFAEREDLSKDLKAWNPARRAYAKGVQDAANELASYIEAPGIIEGADAEETKYSYLKREDHYRMIPCDEDVTCAACGMKRPRLRNEVIRRCQCCGAIFEGPIG